MARVYKVDSSYPLGTIQNPYPVGSQENPCTAMNSKRGERGGKHCLCSGCKKVGICSPRSDYYEHAFKEGLFCSKCFNLPL